MFGNRRHQRTMVDPDPIWKTLELVNEWIRHAEAKAGATLAGTIAVAAGSFVLWQASTPVWDWWLAATAGLAIAAFLATAWLSIASLVPRLRVAPRRDVGNPNPLYFNDIAKWFDGRGAYLAELMAISAQPELLAKELARQVWVNSIVASKKFRWANRAVVTLTIQVTLTVLNALTIVSRAAFG